MLYFIITIHFASLSGGETDVYAVRSSSVRSRVVIIPSAHAGRYKKAERACDEYTFTFTYYAYTPRKQRTTVYWVVET